MSNFQGKIVCLCGGVGGAKLAAGFSKILAPEQLAIVVNTADDFQHLGFYISPDIDTVLYTLAGISNTQQGWGIEGETWQFMKELEQRDPDNAWFRLGDQDMATHRLRTQWRGEGYSLTEITRRLSAHYGVLHNIIPMSDETVSTIVQTADAELPFQHYFVREQCKPAVSGFHFKGIERAKPAEAFLTALEDPALTAVIICPSNPFVSIDPILSLPGLRDTLKALRAPILAISPVIGGQAIKGPTAKMMDELNIPKTSEAIARHYQEVLDVLVIDQRDLPEHNAVEALGLRCLSTNTWMKSMDDKIALARFILQHIA